MPGRIVPVSRLTRPRRPWMVEAFDASRWYPIDREDAEADARAKVAMLRRRGIALPLRVRRDETAGSRRRSP